MPLFEARVRVRNKNSKRYSSLLGMYIFDEAIKMFHINANHKEQASKKAEKYGDVLKVRKADVEKMGRSIEQLDLRQPPTYVSEYLNAISMEEMIWQRQKKCVKRNNDYEE